MEPITGEQAGAGLVHWSNLLSLTVEQNSKAASELQQAAGRRCGEIFTILPSRVSKCLSSSFAPSRAADVLHCCCHFLNEYVDTKVKLTRDKYRSYCTNF